MTPCLLQHQGYMYQLNSKILKPYCKCSYSLPAAKPAVYPQICAPLLPLLWVPTPTDLFSRLILTYLLYYLLHWNVCNQEEERRGSGRTVVLTCNH